MPVEADLPPTEEKRWKVGSLSACDRPWSPEERRTCSHTAAGSGSGRPALRACTESNTQSAAPSVCDVPPRHSVRASSPW